MGATGPLVAADVYSTLPELLCWLRTSKAGRKPQPVSKIRVPRPPYISYEPPGSAQEATAPSRSKSADRPTVSGHPQGAYCQHPGRENSIRFRPLAQRTVRDIELCGHILFRWLRRSQRSLGAVRHLERRLNLDVVAERAGSAVPDHPRSVLRYRSACRSQGSRRPASSPAWPRRQAASSRRAAARSRSGNSPRTAADYCVAVRRVMVVGSLRHRPERACDAVVPAGSTPALNGQRRAITPGWHFEAFWPAGGGCA